MLPFQIWSLKYYVRAFFGVMHHTHTHTYHANTHTPSHKNDQRIIHFLLIIFDNRCILALIVAPLHTAHPSQNPTSLLKPFMNVKCIECIYPPLA